MRVQKSSNASPKICPNQFAQLSVWLGSFNFRNGAMKINFEVLNSVNCFTSQLLFEKRRYV